MNRAIYAGTVRMLTVLGLLVMVACVSTTQTTNVRTSQPTGEAGDINYQLGTEYYRKGNFELARDRLLRAIDQEPRNADAHSALAMTYVQLGSDRLATESFAKAVRLAPNSINVRNAFAVYLCQQRQYDDALEQFDRAIGLPNNDNSYVMMTNAGVCVAKKPDLARAERYFRSALDLRPSYGEALIQMAALMHRTDENFAARGFLQRFLAANEASPAVLYLAVQIETQNGDDRAATDYMNRLLRDFPDSAEARLLLQRGR